MTANSQILIRFSTFDDVEMYNRIKELYPQHGGIQSILRHLIEELANNNVSYKDAITISLNTLQCAPQIPVSRNTQASGGKSSDISKDEYYQQIIEYIRKQAAYAVYDALYDKCFEYWINTSDGKEMMYPLSADSDSMNAFGERCVQNKSVVDMYQIIMQHPVISYPLFKLFKDNFEPIYDDMHRHGIIECLPYGRDIREREVKYKRNNYRYFRAFNQEIYERDIMYPGHYKQICCAEHIWGKIPHPDDIIKQQLAEQIKEQNSHLPTT